MARISCITSTYNRPKELERAIKSVNNQNIEDWEHIIVHDGPASDETKAVIDKYADPRRKFIELPENHGHHTKPKNVGIMASTGQYICYLDDDNEYFPSFMQILSTTLDMDMIDVVYGLERIFKDENDERGSEAISAPFDPQFLLYRSYIDTNVAMHTRKAIFSVGGWDETVPRFADWNLFVRMAKAGLWFKQVPTVITKYYSSKDSSAARYPVKSWMDHEMGLMIFDPTYFNTASCFIYLDYLQEAKSPDDQEMVKQYQQKEKNPKVAIFTLTKDRLEYTMKMQQSMKEGSQYPFDWYVFDNGSTDNTPDWLTNRQQNGECKIVELSKENRGITYASNACVDAILLSHEYQIVGKVDNDCLFLTKGWLETMVDLWRRNHKLYMAPYPEGLVDHPGGSWRVGHSTIGEEFVEVAAHLPGLCAFIDSSAFYNFRWRDDFYHGQQDVEATTNFKSRAFMPCVIPRHRIQHMDTTVGQKLKFPEYFEKRKQEKTTKVQRDYQTVQEEESSWNEYSYWGSRVKKHVQDLREYFTGKVLDVGCNDGTAMEEIIKLQPKDLWGIDLHAGKVKRARDKGFQVKIGKMEKLPFGDKEFDVVFCSHTFEHASDGKLAASELQRVAKRGIIIVPMEKETNNPAHTNNILDEQYFLDFFPHATVVHKKQQVNTDWELVIVLDFP